MTSLLLTAMRQTMPSVTSMTSLSGSVQRPSEEKVKHVVVVEEEGHLKDVKRMSRRRATLRSSSQSSRSSTRYGEMVEEIITKMV